MSEVEMKVILENERVRVVKVRIPAGAKTESHSHPPFVTYALTSARARVTHPSGEVRDVVRKQGEISYSEGVTHIVENTGSEEMMSLDVELKG